MASAGPFSTLKFSFLHFLYYAFSFDNFRDIIHIPNCPAGNCAVETAALLSVIPPFPLSVKQIRFGCGSVMRRLLCSACSYLY